MYRKYLINGWSENREFFIRTLKEQEPTEEQLKNIQNGECVKVGENTFEIENANGI